jgi:hypothetical protein
MHTRVCPVQTSCTVQVSPLEAYFGSLPSRRTQRPPPIVPVLYCTVPVYKPLCIRNKPVLSQSLSLLHVHGPIVFFASIFSCYFVLIAIKIYIKIRLCCRERGYPTPSLPQ